MESEVLATTGSQHIVRCAKLSPLGQVNHHRSKRPHLIS